MKMNIAVVDDNTGELENLSGLIRKFGEDRNLEVNVQSFSSFSLADEKAMRVLYVLPSLSLIST